MLRIVVRTDDANMAANVGGSVATELKTFDVDLPELEKFLRMPQTEEWKYSHRYVIGVEVLG